MIEYIIGLYQARLNTIPIKPRTNLMGISIDLHHHMKYYDFSVEVHYTYIKDIKGIIISLK